jgi:hypothetical protein
MGKQKPELPQGTLDMLVLKALSLGRCTRTELVNALGSLPKTCSRWKRARCTRRSTALSNAGGSKASGEYRRTTGGRAQVLTLIREFKDGKVVRTFCHRCPPSEPGEMGRVP